MFSMSLIRFLGFLSVLVASMAWGSTFNLLDLGANLPDPLVLNADGIQLRLTAGLAFNSSSTSFGIDESTSGGYVDDPNLIDGVETLFMFFDQDVFLDSITISQFDGQDRGVLLLKGVTTFTLSNGIVDAGGIRLRANSSDYRVVSTIGTISGGTRGFSLDQIRVRAVPEPAAWSLALLGVAAAATRRGRRLTRRCS